MSDVNMDILNDDCLLYILNLLTLKERVHIELVCKRWQGLCRQLWKHTRKLVVGSNTPAYCSFYFRFDKPILEPLLKLCGTGLKSLSVSYVHHNSALELIAQYCDSLNYLSLKDCRITNPGIETFCANIHSLTELKLSYVDISNKQLKEFFTSQPKLKSLILYSIETLNRPKFDKLNEEVESISIRKCYGMNTISLVKNLKKFKHLKNFCISSQENLRINEILKAIPQIESLQIVGGDENEKLIEIGIFKNLRSLYLDLLSPITDASIVNIANNCHLLEYIHLGDEVTTSLTTNNGVKQLAALPKLKKIKLRGIQQIINDEVLEVWASYGRLTHIDIYGCVDVTDRGAIMLLEQCPDLQDLNILHCNITMATLQKAVEVIKKKPLHPLLCIFIGLRSGDLRLDEYKYINTCLQIHICK